MADYSVWAKQPTSWANAFQWTFAVDGQTPDHFILQNTDNTFTIVYGWDFSYSPEGTLTGGTITGLVRRSTADATYPGDPDAPFDLETIYFDGDFKSAASFGQVNSPHGFKDFFLVGNDTITIYDPAGAAVEGGSGNDFFVGGDGADDMAGGAGDDVFVASKGNDTMDGGDLSDVNEYDEVRYNHSATGVNVNLTTGTASDGLGGTDTLRDIEAVVGSRHNDTLTGGNPHAQIVEDFHGLDGADVINGGLGTDQIRYEREQQFGGAGGVIVNLSTVGLTNVNIGGGAKNVAAGTAIDSFGKGRLRPYRYP